MNIIISGIHLKKFPELEDYTREKVERLQKYFPRIQEIQVRLFSEKAHRNQKHDFGCEIKVVIPGNDLEIFESELEMDTAIDKAVDTTRRALVKHKEKTVSKKHKGGLEQKGKGSF